MLHGQLFGVKLFEAVLTGVVIPDADVGFVELHTATGFHIGATDHHAGHLHGHTGAVYIPAIMIFQNNHLIQPHLLDGIPPGESAQWCNTERTVVCIEYQG